jgi:hypothetical protein
VLLSTLGCGDGAASNDPGPAGGASGSGGSVSGSSADAGSKSDAGSSGGGSGGMGGAGGSPATPQACGPEASMNADGVLTAYPNISVTVTPATDFEITSFNFVVTDDGDARGPLLEFFADLKNIGTQQHCQFLPMVYLGADELITLVYGPPKHLKIGTTVFTTVDECIGPGESAVMSGVQRGITEAALEAATSLTIDPGPSNFETDEYLPAVAPTIQDAQVVTADAEFLLKGTVSYTENIRNQGIRVYPRDSRQLLVGELLAFPGDLGPHLAGSTAPFETESTPCGFTEYELFQSWITED